MKLKSEFLNEIKERGFIYQDTDITNLDNIISKNKISSYIGFDITSDSLHVGSLIQLMLLHWLDYYGHKSIGLIGGGNAIRRIRSDLMVKIADPWEMLGIDRDATNADIKKAYRTKLAGLHPDKVARMDPEIQDLARTRTVELRGAYETVLEERP